MKILLAQTDDGNLEMIETILLPEGHEIISVTDGKDVMVALREKPDMIIMPACRMSADLNAVGSSSIQKNICASRLSC